MSNLYSRRCSFLIYGRLWSLFPTGKGEGGYSGFQVIGMIEWGQKSKPIKSLGLQTKTPKIPGPKFNPSKIPCRIS